MYRVYFQLPTLVAAPYVRNKIHEDLEAWRKLYGIPYRGYTEEYKYIVELALDKDATWFALTWTGRKYYKIEQV